MSAEKNAVESSDRRTDQPTELRDHPFTPCSASPDPNLFNLTSSPPRPAPVYPPSRPWHTRPPFEQSSSPLDPMFWPMHGTMERLWQFAVLTGQVTDFTWPDEDMNVTLPDGTIDTQYVSSYEVCIGHRGSDVFPYGLLSSDVDTFEVKTGIRSNPVTGNELTNREVLASLDPRSNPLTYVYDTFKWEHCGPEGYDFDDAWRETVPSPRKQFYQRDEPRSTLYTSFKREMAELMKENHGSSFEEA